MKVTFECTYLPADDGDSYKTRKEISFTESQGIRDAWIILGRLASEETDELIAVKKVKTDDLP